MQGVQRCEMLHLLAKLNLKLVCSQVARGATAVCRMHCTSLLLQCCETTVLCSAARSAAVRHGLFGRTRLADTLLTSEVTSWIQIFRCPTGHHRLHSPYTHPHCFLPPILPGKSPECNFTTFLLPFSPPRCLCQVLFHFVILLFYQVWPDMKHNYSYICLIICSNSCLSELKGAYLQ